MTSTNSESSPPQALIRLADEPPTTVPAILLDDLVPFPGPIAPILLENPLRRDAVLKAKETNGFLILINRRSTTTHAEADANGRIDAERIVAQMEAALARVVGGVEDLSDSDALSASKKKSDDSTSSSNDNKVPAPAVTSLAELSSVGILARLVKVIRLPDDRLSAMVQLLRRTQPVDVVQSEPFPMLRVMYPAEIVTDEEQFQSTYRQIRLHLQKFLEAHPSVSDELKLAALALEVPSALADFVAQHLSRDFNERMTFLTELDLNRRMRKALEVVLRELDLLTVGNRISQEIRDKVEKHQRDFLLREQLKAIRAELGEEKDPAALAVSELRERLSKAGLSELAAQRAQEELKRLQLVPQESPEHNVVRSYLDWIASLPWSTMSEDSTDVERARQILDADHFGLDEIKDRIIEFLAVHQLNPNKAGSILCFSGPPGVGKTSLGQSIARALGREFYRLSVGGMRDEAEIKGHRRTYIGAMPGRILQGLKQVKTANPVFMLDELDKMGNDWRGDPSSALLEVLDPAQNKMFSDHYLDLPFDLSRVMFIATANVEAEIPGPLRDRLEVIELPGYIPEEKVEIASQHLFPRQRLDHGLSRRQLQISRSAFKRIVREYTHEAGVRELNRLLGKVCRKRAVEVIQKRKFQAHVGLAEVPSYLGPTKIHDDRLTKRPVPGVAVGLAWTPVGGDVLFIELVTMSGRGNVKVTGHLGEVMSESAQLAVSYVRSRAKDLNIAPSAFKQLDFHLHFPAGAVKKDGPSAGITVTSALISLLTERPIQKQLAMTGEMTLRGEVLPVGGIREKVVAARRAGVRTVIVPERNRADVEQIPEDVRDELTFVYASHFDDVMAAAFAMPKIKARPKTLSVSRAKKLVALGAKRTAR